MPSAEKGSFREPGPESFPEELVTDRKNIIIPAQVKKAFRFMGWMFLIMGLLLCLLGVLCLPDGGLLFALPYFFLIPGIALAAIGSLMVLLTRGLKKAGMGPDPVISEQRLP
jgi:vacuolar-type H+-ATPase subunit I/STV1